MSDLNSTVALVPALEHVFVLTDVKARKGKRGGGGEVDSKALGAYGRDVLNENGELLLCFAEDNKLALLNTFFYTPKSGVSFTFQIANCGKGQARPDYILTKQADRRLVRCVKVRSPPLESAEWDRNLVYATVRIPRRSAPNSRIKQSTKATRNTVNLQRLMAYSDLRRQMASVMSAERSPIPNDNCIGEISADMADLMLPILARFALRSKRPRRPKGWCVYPGMQVDMNAAWQQREEAKKRFSGKP